MKNLRPFITLILLTLPVLAHAAEPKRLPTVSSITAVTVYPDRALTTRTATLNLKTGSYLVTFESLPTLLQDDSVRVEGKGSAAVIIAGLEVKRVFLEQSGEKRVKELDGEIRLLEQRIAELDSKKAGLASQKAFLESIRVAWGERVSKELAIGRPVVAELQDAAGYVGSGVTRIAEQTGEIEREQKSLKAKIEALQRQRQEATGSRRQESKCVEVMLEVTREGSFVLELSTLTPQAGWVPSYDVRLAPDAKTAELTFRAVVRQQTGEDWNGVDLTLSTARPSAGGAPPELTPWHISLFRPQPIQQSAARFVSAAAPLRSMKAKMATRSVDTSIAGDALAEEAQAQFETALISAEQASVSFHLSRPLDIPADGSQHGSVVAIEQLPVTMEFLAIPKLSPFVFLKSGIVNRAAYPLLPGKVNTFSGNTFTGSAQLKKVAVGEKFDLFFGTDDQVTVKREELKQHKDAGVFSKNSVSYRYRLELNNFRKEPVTLTLRDQLPLAGDEEIKITLDNPSIKPDESGTDGRISWKIQLMAGEKQEMSFGILVEYPKDREITGL